jgi:putative DNA primase/helicase
MTAPAVSILSPKFDRIPEALHALPWGVWKGETRANGKISKAPRHPRTAALLKTNEPAAWATFEECRAAVEAGRFDGLGVLLDGTAGLVGIDIDSWRETAERFDGLRFLLKRAQEEGLYLEKSPSGEGLRLFVRGTIKAEGRRKGGIELYKSGRFLTVTGRGEGEVGDGQRLVDGLLKLIGGDEAPDEATGGVIAANEPSGANPRMVEALAEKVAEKEPRLWAGEWERAETGLGTVGYESQSDADLALCGAIARLAVREGVAREALAATVEVVFGLSGLTRDKWTDRADYRERTISKALEGLPAGLPAQGGEAAEDREAHGDVLNAGYFVRLYGDEFRFVPPAGKWLRWAGAVWEWCERNEPLNAAEDVVRRIIEHGKKLLDSQPDRGKRIIGHAVKSHTVQKMEAMTKLASAKPGMSVLLHELDSDPWLLGVRNGVVDLRTGELLEARPDMLITRQCGAAYDKFAECPRWLGFLDAVFGGDADTIETIQRALGYTLTGSSTEETLFICYGGGANGKSVFANVESSIMADYGRTAPSSLLVVRRDGDTGARNDLAMLAGARYVGINELQNGDRLDEAIVKQLAGREPISARFLHKEFFTFVPQFTPWLRTNHRPVVTGDDDGIWRRLVLIPFRRQFAEHERDPRLEEKLLGERDGILAWMIEGARKWRRDGLKLSPLIKRESLAYRKESDLLGEFLEDKCESDSNARVEQGKLFGSWRDWCEAAGVRHGSKASFTRRLAERGITEGRSNGKRFYVGVTFRQSAAG